MRYFLTALVLICLIGSGCQKAASSPHFVIPSPQIDDTDPEILVVYGNEEFRDKVHVIRKSFDASQRLAKCSVTLQNTSNDTFVLEYQFRWLEQSGMPVMQTPAWSRVTLAPNAVRPLINMAKTPEAAIVEFTLRLPMTALYEIPVEE
jgi:uncharacterized protein YcfL